jgi:hypothetical protein
LNRVSAYTNLGKRRMEGKSEASVDEI